MECNDAPTRAISVDGVLETGSSIFQEHAILLMLGDVSNPNNATEIHHLQSGSPLGPL